MMGCLLLTACARGPKGTWRASHPRGDDPAIGIELKRDGSKYSGTMFLLNPNAPQDFSYGPQFTMTIHSVDAQEIRYSVEFLPHEPDELVLRLNKPVDGPSFHAVMSSVDGRGEPLDFNFERVLEK